MRRSRHRIQKHRTAFFINGSVITSLLLIIIVLFDLFALKYEQIMCQHNIASENAETAFLKTFLKRQIR
jgi:hypothetical protein